MFVLRRILMISVLWSLLTGGAVFVCSSGDTEWIRNRPPVARDDSYSVPAGTTLIGAVRATDPDGDFLVYRVVTGPELGVLEGFNGNTGAFRYLSERQGSDRFEFRASDGRLDSNTARISIEVTADSGASSLFGTAAGPVVLAGDALLLAGPGGGTELASGVVGLEAGGTLRWADGRTGCLDPWGGIRTEGGCGGVTDPSVGLADPYSQGRYLRARADDRGTRIEQRLGEGPWSLLARASLPGEGAAIHFDVSAPGLVWLAVTGDRRTVILSSDDEGRHWSPVATVPGRVTALAGLGAGGSGIFALRAAPDGPLLLELRSERRNNR